ncbi:MAG TPA: hypothetical protein VKI44_22780 [Acetobacteraceae bacterium]|nr:hypothetical protein [Acetobacteraceae bacterium]
MKADTLLVAAGEALLAMLLLAALAVVVAFEPVVAWLWHCHQFEKALTPLTDMIAAFHGLAITLHLTCQGETAWIGGKRGSARPETRSFLPCPPKSARHLR